MTNIHSKAVSIDHCNQATISMIESPAILSYLNWILFTYMLLATSFSVRVWDNTDLMVAIPE